MMLWIITFVIICAVVLLMSIGVMFGRKPLKGSCGGLANAGVNENCNFCGKKTSHCPRKIPLTSKN